MVDGIVKIPWRVTSTERRPEFNQSRNRKEGIPATRQKTDEIYLIEVEKAPGHWIAVVRLPDGTPWNMDRFDPRAPALPKQWVGGTAAAAADFAARVLTNRFAGEGMEDVRKTFRLGGGV